MVGDLVIDCQEAMLWRGPYKCVTILGVQRKRLEVTLSETYRQIPKKTLGNWLKKPE